MAASPLLEAGRVLSLLYKALQEKQLRLPKALEGFTSVGYAKCFASLRRLADMPAARCCPLMQCMGLSVQLWRDCQQVWESAIEKNAFSFGYSLIQSS